MLKIFLVAALIFIPFTVRAQTDQSERRIEEEKRRDLRSTEAQYYESPAIELEADPVLEYFNKLVEREAASFSDGVFIINLLLGKEQLPPDFVGQKQALLDHEVFSAKTVSRYKKDDPLSRGLFARMLFKMLDLKGGLTLRIFGASKRYAYKELIYEGIMFSGSSFEYMSGEELAYSFIQATKYLEKNSGADQ